MPDSSIPPLVNPAPLVPIAKFVNAGGSEGAVKRLEKWALQSVSRSVLCKAQQWRRLCNCCRALQDGRGSVEVRQLAESRPFYAGLQHCGSVWVCPVCGSKIVEYRRGEVSRGIELLRDGGGSWALLTLTFAHGPAHGFVDLDERLAGALHHLRNSRAWKSLKARGLFGSIRAYEVTWGPVNGWHPHVHMLLAWGGSLPIGLEGLLWSAWRAALATVGLSASLPAGLKLQATYGAVADYVAKWGVEPVRRPWGTEDELTRGVSKSARSGARFTPLDLLRAYASTGEAEYRDRFREYAAATRGRSQLRWSPGLRLLLGLGEVVTDEEIAAGVEEGAALLGSLTAVEWSRVLAADQRGELLEVAARGWDEVLAYVSALVGREAA